MVVDLVEAIVVVAVVVLSVCVVASVVLVVVVVAAVVVSVAVLVVLLAELMVKDSRCAIAITVIVCMFLWLCPGMNHFGECWRWRRDFVARFFYVASPPVDRHCGPKTH